MAEQYTPELMTAERITTQDIENSLRGALRDIAIYWDEMLPGIKARATGTIGRTSVVADLIHEHVLYVRTETIDILTSWARLIAEERNLRPRITVGDVTALAAFVENHYDWLARHEAGLDAADEISQWARSVRAVAQPRHKEDQEFLGQCQCGQRVHAAYDANVVACPACGREENRTDYRDRGYGVLRGYAYTPEDAVKVGAILGKPVLRNTINKWGSTKKIQPVAATRGGNPLYRWADIENQMAQIGRRKARPNIKALIGA